MNGQPILLTAEQLHGAERVLALQQFTASAPRFVQYQRKTDRVGYGSTAPGSRISWRGDRRP